ncbi:MAG TPA: M48 family metallopeptidase [Actinomycetota bacterium]|nr:M48 family metallopeptidase [Actinomycetota bacterium]
MTAPRSRLRLILIAAALAAAGFALAAPAIGAQPDEPRVTDYFTQEQIERSRDYTGTRYVLGFSSLVLGLILAGIVGLGPAARALGGWAERVSGGRWPLTALILAAVVTLIPVLATLPLAVARGYWHERRFGLSTQSLGGFLADVGKGAGVQVVVAGVVALAFFFIVRRLPVTWPLAAAAVMVALTVVMVVVYPLVYEPLFNKFTPVDPATRERIVALADRAGVTVDRVLVADASRRTKRLNAYVSGLGATKRVVLYDTLLERSPPDEVDLIVAHELAHVVHRDVLRGTILGSAGAIGAVVLVWLLTGRPGVLRFAGASGPGDPRLIPLLAFTMAVATLVTLPLANGFSRSIEADADRFAVRLTGDVQTAIRTEVSLARENIADLRPHPLIRWMFFTHPPVMERIEIALEAAP